MIAMFILHKNRKPKFSSYSNSTLSTGGKLLRQHELEIRVRYEDADPMGFLHHSKYFVYFEMGRMASFRESGGNYRELEESGLFVVVVKAECQFRRPAKYDDVLTVRTKLVQTSMAKIEHEYELLRAQEHLASARVTLALVDRDGKVNPVPQWLQELA